MSAGYGYEALTTTSATGLTIPDAFVYSAVVSVATESVRWRADGVAPSSTVGILIPAGEEREFVGKNTLSLLQIIDASGAAAVKVHYFPKVQ